MEERAAEAETVVADGGTAAAAAGAAVVAAGAVCGNSTLAPCPAACLPGAEPGSAAAPRPLPTLGDVSAVRRFSPVYTDRETQSERDTHVEE